MATRVPAHVTLVKPVQVPERLVEGEKFVKWDEVSLMPKLLLGLFINIASCEMLSGNCYVFIIFRLNSQSSPG